MLNALAAVFPIFALVLVGWLVRRVGILGPLATTELNRFVVYLALPALLFDVIANAAWHQLWLPGFIGAFGISSIVCMATAVVLRLRTRPLTDSAIDGLNAGYANVGYMGFPITAAILGRDALIPTTISAIITVCVVFGTAIVLIEIGQQTRERSDGEGTAEHNVGRLALRVLTSLAKNPLLIAPAVAALFPLAGATVPGPLDAFMKLLGGAASPCALVALGLFLAADHDNTRQDGAAVATLTAMKLLLHPLMAWGLAVFVFALPPLELHAAVMLAALPAGTGAFMLATLYTRDAHVSSKVILISTILSLASVSAYVAFAGIGR